MAHAQKCPICNGEGKYKEQTCHGCGGKGWIEVQDRDQLHGFLWPPKMPRPLKRPY